MWILRRSPIPTWCPLTVARALGLPDQPGRSTMDPLLRFVRDRQMLVVTETPKR
jgi:predicted ATPase